MHTGAWAHAATALREDLPASPEEEAAPPAVVPGQAPFQAHAEPNGAQSAASFPAAPPQLSAGPPLPVLATPPPHAALLHPAHGQPEALQARQRSPGVAAPAWQHEQASAGTPMQQGHVLLQGLASTGPALSAGLALQGAQAGQLPAPMSHVLPAGGAPAAHGMLGSLPAAAPSALGVQQGASLGTLPGAHPGSISAPGQA